MSVELDAPFDPAVGHPQRWHVLGVCALGLFLLVTSLTSLNVALPEIQIRLNASTSDLQWIIDSYAVVFGGLLLTGGSIGDRIGRRPSLLIGFALVALGGAVGGVAGSVEIVIVARLIGGLGAALMLPATLSALTDVFADGERARAIAIWSGIAGAGGAFGPAIGGWLLEISGWGSVFVMNAVLAAVGFVATVLVVPRLPGHRRGPIDLPGAALSTTAIGLALFAIIEAPSHWTDTMVIGAAVGSVAAVVAFVVHESRTSDPMLPLEVLRRPRVRVGAITHIMSAVGFAGVIFVASLLLQIGWGERPLTTGLLLVPIGATELISSAKSVDLTRRFGVGRVITVGLIMMATGYIGMALTPTGDRLSFVLAGAIAGAGNGLVIAPTVERIVGGAEAELAGVTAGVNETSIELGASLGIAVLGGVQRIVFDLRLPVGTPSSSVETAIAAADPELVLAAFRDSGRAGLVAAALAVIVVVPIAGRRLDTDP